MLHYYITIIKQLCAVIMMVVVYCCHCIASQLLSGSHGKSTRKVFDWYCECSKMDDFD